jgi:hypothetical protein
VSIGKSQRHKAVFRPEEALGSRIKPCGSAEAGAVADDPALFQNIIPRSLVLFARTPLGSAWTPSVMSRPKCHITVARNRPSVRTHLMLKQLSLCLLQARVCGFEL